MPSTPRIEQRSEQQYVAIRATTPMSGLGAVAPPLVGEVSGWLEVRGIEPGGPPFFRYLVVEMEHELELDVCVPVAQATRGDGRVHSASLPPGDYATAVFTGPYEQLEQATAELLGWAEASGVGWDSEPTATGEKWAARVEHYLTDLEAEPDPTKWETMLAFKTRSESG